MEKIKFKTNINCGGCVAKVKPYLDQAVDITWSVDTANPDKVLTVEGQNVDGELIKNLVIEAGFSIEKKRDFIGRLFS